MAKKVHRVVAEAFIPKNGEDKVCVNHKNGNRLSTEVHRLRRWLPRRVPLSEECVLRYEYFGHPLGRVSLLSVATQVGGHDKPKKKRRKKWPSMTEFEFGA